MNERGDMTEHDDVERGSAVFARNRWNRTLMQTMPLMVAGAMTVGMTLTGAVAPAAASPKKPVTPKQELRPSIAPAVTPAVAPAAVTPAAAAPSTYRVAAGDTVSSIAGRFGISTASVLAMNGLGWKSLIFPGQVLKLGGSAASAPVAAAPAPAAVAGGSYTIKAGDTVSKIAAKFGVTVQSVLTANGLRTSSIIYPGQTLRIPTTTAAPVAAPVTPSAPTAAGSYTIRSGDTITSIATRFGVTTRALLKANGLTASSIIYAGRTLRIPGSGATTPTTATPPAPIGSGAVTQLTPSMAANAAIVVRVGRELGVSDRGIVIALAAAMQESSLRNIDHGDRDSVGLFQQRPSMGWGPKHRLLDVAHAARLFYGGPQNPNVGRTRGLLDIPGWQQKSVAQAAQAVQVSAHPAAYGTWERSAWAWLSQLG